VSSGVQLPGAAPAPQIDQYWNTTPEKLPACGTRASRAASSPVALMSAASHTYTLRAAAGAGAAAKGASRTQKPSGEKWRPGAQAVQHPANGHGAGALTAMQRGGNVGGAPWLRQRPSAPTVKLSLGCP
jgi:hypothetical protein